MRTIPDEDKSKSIKNMMPSSSLRERVLGVHWHVLTEDFFCKIVVPDSPATEREMLSVTHSLYDPIGFVLPVILRARLLYSEVCTDKTGWNEQLAGVRLKSWESCVKGLADLDTARTPRCTKPEVQGQQLQIQLHFLRTLQLLPDVQFPI